MNGLLRDYFPKGNGNAAWTFAVGIVLCAAAVLTIVRGSGTTRFRSETDVFN
jgi:hypothetical protein